MSNERYELTAGPAKMGAARLLYVAYSKYDAGWHSTPHTHTHAEIFYCLRGHGSLHAGADEVPLAADDLILINPGISHTENSCCQPPLEYIVLGADHVEFQWPGRAETRYAVLPVKERRAELLPLFEDIVREMAARGNACEQACQLLMQLLLIKIERMADCGVSLRAETTLSPECAEVRRFIDEHFFEDIDLDTLARHTHINKFYLAHQFQKEQGISPIRFLTERRIRECKYLLENTDHSLAQISEMAGFSSLSYFSQSFRRSVGLSPSEYRAAVRHAT